MKLLLRRDQRSGMLGGKPVFSLEVRAEITDEERAAISKYRLGETELYASYEVLDRGSGLLGVASRLAFKAITLTITVNDLANGKRVECKDVVEMLAIEEHVRDAARTFADVLAAARQFGGEEVLELA
jgi:hypothetical protein